MFAKKTVEYPWDVPCKAAEPYEQKLTKDQWERNAASDLAEVKRLETLEYLLDSIKDEVDACLAASWADAYKSVRGY